MKTYRLVLFLTILGLSFSCKDKDSVQPEQDPLVGVWKLRALQAGGQTADVTELACYRDTRFEITENNLLLTVSVPAQQGSSNCQQQSQSATWEKTDGKYYMISDGQRQDSGIQLNDNNQTLQLPVTVNGEQMLLVFRK
ncbi:hypothetical protein GCM10027275_53240 [Rhabdobacter roseus]|uniref:Lipocalin-like domain-containing protein n=1 Tax=Rhabdobacter roseus TaxID=1655419 RepID=A0A840TTQ8_9BACT|nr:lipocalin family protein [Rhabdobacter roseus]MBB5286285.1 hypothetical protein [Rhabdobacter roseus]